MINYSNFLSLCPPSVIYVWENFAGKFIIIFAKHTEKAFLGFARVSDLPTVFCVKSNLKSFRPMQAQLKFSSNKARKIPI